MSGLNYNDYLNDDSLSDTNDFTQLCEMMNGTLIQNDVDYLDDLNNLNDSMNRNRIIGSNPYRRLLRLPHRDQVLIINAIEEIEDQRSVIEKKYKQALQKNKELEKSHNKIEKKYKDMEKKYNKLSNQGLDSEFDDMWAKYVKIRVRYNDLLKQCVGCMQINPMMMRIRNNVDENSYKIIMYLFSNLRIVKKYDPEINIDGVNLSNTLINFIKTINDKNVVDEIKKLEDQIYDSLDKINKNKFSNDARILYDGLSLFFNMIKRSVSNNLEAAVSGIGSAIAYIQIQGYVQYLSDRITLDKDNLRLNVKNKKLQDLVDKINRDIMKKYQTNDLFKGIVVRAGRLINQNNHEIIKIYSYVQQCVFNIIISAIYGSLFDDINDANNEASEFYTIDEQKLCDFMNSNRDQCIMEWTKMINGIKSKISYPQCDVRIKYQQLMPDTVGLSDDRKKVICWAKTAGFEIIDILTQSLPKIIRHALNVDEREVALLLFATQNLGMKGGGKKYKSIKL